jgi:hypothetical protein
LYFPCVDGLENANIFKKASVFLCEFIGEQIIENIESDSFCDKITKIPSYESAIVGFHVVTTLLNGAIVGGRTIENPIELSQHSYIDIIDALSSASINTSFRLIAVFLEQLVYKTNPNLQYSGTTPINLIIHNSKYSKYFAFVKSNKTLNVNPKYPCFYRPLAIKPSA